MADNYLEKRMDDYRRGVNKTSSRRYHNNTPSNKLIAVAPQRMMLLIEDKELLAALLSEFAGVTELKVAFAGSDSKEGNRLAQACGALFVGVKGYDCHCIGEARDVIAQRWGGIDTVITDRPDCAGLPEIRRTILYAANKSDISDSGTDTKGNVAKVILPEAPYDCRSIAKMTMLLLTPQAAVISTIEMGAMP